LTVLHRCLGPLLVGVQARRLTTLLEAVAATMGGPRPMLTDTSRRFGGGAGSRNKVKRADCWLGNGRLQRDARTI